MQKHLRNLLLLFAATFFACANPDPMQPVEGASAPETTPHFVSADAALARLEGSLHAFVPQTRGAVRFRTVEPVGPATRSEGVLPSGYIVNFEEGGYAILSADDRKAPVVAFAPEGSLSADEFEQAHLLTTADARGVSTPDYIRALIRNYLTAPVQGDLPATRADGSPVVEEQTAMMHTKWTDVAPYNSFIKSRNPAGAPNIALAQILVYNHKYHGVGLDEMNIYNSMSFPNLYNPDWSLLDIAAIYADAGDSSAGIEAGKFIAAVSIANGTIYGHNQSITPVANVQTFLTDFWGYRLAQIKPFATTTLANLKKSLRAMIYTDRIPVYFYGDSQNVISHAWIADGWMVLDANNTRSSYIHCNFCVGAKYDLWLLFESNTPFSVLFPYGGTDTTENFDIGVSMIDYML